jgi:hypothetical protein
METQLTQEEIQKSISAAYDSVTVINALNEQLSLTEEDAEALNRNKEHISIMLSKEWFIEALTPTQTTELNAVLN